MKVLVTGANGYLGQGIVRHILNCGVELIAADFKVDHIDERADRRECDLFAIENPYVYFGCPDVLLHLAWRDGFVHYSDAHIDDLSKHYAFVRKFTESGVNKIAAMGSMHEIGFYEGSIKEDTPCNPTTPYGISKNALRMLTEMLCKKNGKRGKIQVIGGANDKDNVLKTIFRGRVIGTVDMPEITDPNAIFM